MTGTTSLPHCDLVLKGGITSGVVYPLAVKRLSEAYRFRQVGGTSAGAIAAVFAAAAEYGRDTGGFDRIGELPEELSTSLLEKFQPVPELAPLFGLLLAALTGRSGAELREPVKGDRPPAKGRGRAILRALLTGYPRAALAGAAPGAALLLLAALPGMAGAVMPVLLSNTLAGLLPPLAIAVHLVLAAVLPGSVGAAVLGLLLCAAGAVALPLATAARQAARGLADHDFGLCPGTTQPGFAPESALCDWMTRRIDEIAGLPPEGPPLTVAMLEGHGVDRTDRISVRTVTTDITTQRPYTLPMRNNLHAFSPAEFRRVFPERVVEHMIQSSSPVKPDWGEDRGDLRYFQMDALPVVVLARMSLSFPGLISAVPLHRIDHTLRNATPGQKRRRCLFSDGGLSSNFPVHLFDHVLPHVPTFGISLAQYDPLRARAGDPHGGRIHMPAAPGAGRLLPTRPFSGLGGMVMALFDSAKDWQDSLQAVLTGYRERIVTVNLTADEGGLNLDMGPEVVTTLGTYGARAGEALVGTFDRRQHRLRRFLTELPAIERLLIDFADQWEDNEPEPGAMTYPDLVLAKGEKPYALPDSLRRKLHDRAARIAALGAEFRADTLNKSEVKRLPYSRSRMRLIANMD